MITTTIARSTRHADTDLTSYEDSTYARRRDLLGPVLPPAPLWRDFFVFRLKPLFPVGAGRCRPHSVRKHCSGCVHAQPFLRKAANQLPIDLPDNVARWPPDGCRWSPALVVDQATG
jgi:hypothetical protein